MKHMLKIGIGILLMTVGAYAEEIQGIVNTSTSGTTSAMAYITAGNSTAVKLTDIAWKVDAGNVSSTLNIRQGIKRFASTSATTSSAVVWFANADSQIAAGSYLLFEDTSAGSLTLTRASAASTTSATCYDTFSATTSDNVWALSTVVTRPAVDTATSGTKLPGDVWLPGSAPTALILDGNTTACKLSVSGARVR